MDLQSRIDHGNDGSAFRILSGLLLLTATALLVGSLVTAHSANLSPNSGRVTVDRVI